MKKANATTLTKQAINKIVANVDLSKSAKIKALFDASLEVKEISELLSIRYNFAYNVISNYVNMNSVEVEKSNKTSKKDLIIALHKQEKSMKEISIELQTNYNYVFNTIKEFKSKSAQ